MRILELTTIESRKLKKEGHLEKIKNGVRYELVWDNSTKECQIVNTESTPLTVYNPLTSNDSIRLTFEEAKELKANGVSIQVERGGDVYTVTIDNIAYIHSVCDIVLVRK